jgi:hypothetical protein
VVASKGRAQVAYGVPGALGSDDSIAVHLPHVGRISLAFDPAHTTRHQAPDNCNGRASIVESGYFRGLIELRGERGFTTVDRTSARGRVVRSFRQVCDNGPPTGAGEGQRVTSTLLDAGPRHSGERLGFLASTTTFGSETALVSFDASSLRFREGMSVVSRVTAEGEASDFITPRPGEPKVSEVTPPAPFSGTARFELTSAKTSTWEGDLSVELPGLGRVGLAGPNFWSTLCENTHCTETAPANVQVIVG